MDAKVRDTVRECSRISDEGHTPFPRLVTRLAGVGIERYHADLVRSEKTYYLPNGESETVPNEPTGGTPAQAFSADGVVAALRAIQAGQTRYKTFCEQIVAAGCVGYIVSLAGGRAVYYGRAGESYVEWFPRAK